LNVGLGGWFSSDTAPKDGTKILVFESCGELAISHWFEMSHIEYEPVGDLFRRVEIKDGGAWNSNHFDFWMPLPDTPKYELTGSALLPANVEFSGDAPLHGAASAGTKG
jgi:hypothetical protein